MTTARAKFRHGLKRFVEHHYNEKEGNLSDNQRSEGLALFYLSNVFSKLNPGAIPDDPEEISTFIVDGKNDQGVDVIFGHDEHHYLIQCKYHGQKKTESEKEVLHFKEIFQRIHPEVGRDFTKNQRVLDAIAGINWKEDTFELIFISLSKETDNIRNYENQDILPIEHPDLRDIDDRSSFRFLSEADLNVEYEDVTSNRTLTDVVLSAMADSEDKYWYSYESDEGLRSYVTTIDASQIHSLYRKKRQALFNLNIRNFIGDTRTNKGILKTVEKEPHKFFFYNNGISAIASKVIANSKTGELECKNFSIINGAQTFRSVSRAYTKLGSQSESGVRDLAVMIKLTETPNIFKDTHFVEQVTQYNNTQNAVKISDFRSNDGVQKSLAQYFEQISFRGKKYHYKNKRSKDAPRNRIIVNLDEFCKTIHSFDRGPVDYFGGIKYLYDTNINGGYYFLFGDENSNQILESLDEEKFMEFAAKYFICEVTRENFRDERESKIIKEEKATDEASNAPLISKRALEGKYMIFYTVGVVLREISELSNMKFEDFLKSESFHNPSWKSNDKRKIELVRNSVMLSCDFLIEDYRTSLLNSDFVHRNWFREPSTLTRLEERIKNSSFHLSMMYKAFRE